MRKITVAAACVVLLVSIILLLCAEKRRSPEPSHDTQQSSGGTTPPSASTSPDRAQPLSNQAEVDAPPHLQSAASTNTIESLPLIIRRSIAYLAAAQNADGSLGKGNARIEATSFALMLAMRWYIPSIEQERIDGVKAAAWLRQNTPSTDEEKIAVIVALSGLYTVSGNPVTRPPHGEEDKTVIQALLDSIKTRKDNVWFDLLCITKLPSDIERPSWAANDKWITDKYLYPEATFSRKTLEDYIRSLVFASEKCFVDAKAYGEYRTARDKAMTPVQMKNGAFPVQEEGSELSATAAAAMCYAVEDRVAQRFFEFPARKKADHSSAPGTINM